MPTSRRLVRHANSLVCRASTKEGTWVLFEFKSERKGMKMSPTREFEQEQKSIPPLSQSRHGDMACESLYVYKHVQCATLAESEPAARGIEIHQILATYINHLAKTRRGTDLEVLDTLMKGAGAEAREVLEKFRDNHAFDPEKVLATELHIALDENFLPIEASDGHGRTAEYEGTLDLVMVHSLTEAEIDDWKSYYQIIDADTFQSKFYPLLLMCVNPSLERVKFVLEFVRYGASRSVEYTRKDLPWLKELAQRERSRQMDDVRLEQHGTEIHMRKKASGPCVGGGAPRTRRTRKSDPSRERGLRK